MKKLKFGQVHDPPARGAPGLGGVGGVRRKPTTDLAARRAKKNTNGLRMSKPNGTNRLNMAPAVDPLHSAVDHGSLTHSLTRSLTHALTHSRLRMSLGLGMSLGLDDLLHVPWSAAGPWYVAAL